MNQKQPKTKVLTGLAMVLVLAPIVFFSAQALLLPLDAFGARVVTTILTTAVVLNGMTLIVFTLFRQR
ncbi:hypothetical protein FLK61_27615 [Paenalkalicoccus suaedae]|uniref:Uncharacterized protein n=1 Tax=Paenalkalicoccus suaedae TaxID=2592382 RepID=A0A859FCN9_9BACI|nr:hypothetical protein FLK61_27615 [Paenalkalicoccus suaedae]